MRQLFAHQLLLPSRPRGLTNVPSAHGFGLGDYLGRFRLSDINNDDLLPSIQRPLNPGTQLHNRRRLTPSPQ